LRCISIGSATSREVDPVVGDGQVIEAVYNNTQKMKPQKIIVITTRDLVTKHLNVRNHVHTPSQSHWKTKSTVESSGGCRRDTQK